MCLPRGLYRIAGVPVTWKQRALAACMVSGAGAVVSHRSAAVVWDIEALCREAAAILRWAA